MAGWVEKRDRPPGRMDRSGKEVRLERGELYEDGQKSKAATLQDHIGDGAQ